ncbi:TPA: tautomerase family protein [Yersinia enterocolitica]
MPTYYCHLPKECVSKADKHKLAHAITLRHTEATGAPSWFVQVVIEEDTNMIRYLGGEPANDHIWVRADIRAGRTKTQLQQLMLALKADIAAITGIPDEDIWIYLNNIEPDNMLEYGHILPLPGKESAWFDALPPALKRRLDNLGITHANFKL